MRSRQSARALNRGHVPNRHSYSPRSINPTNALPPKSRQPYLPPPHPGVVSPYRVAIRAHSRRTGGGVGSGGAEVVPHQDRIETEAAGEPETCSGGPCGSGSVGRSADKEAMAGQLPKPRRTVRARSQEAGAPRTIPKPRLRGEARSSPYAELPRSGDGASPGRSIERAATSAEPGHRMRPLAHLHPLPVRRTQLPP